MYEHITKDVHIRDFNKSWNYFEGLDELEFEKEIRKSTTWDRPSWKFGTKKIDDNIKEIFNNFKKEYKGNKNKQNQINTKIDDNDQQPLPKHRPCAESIRNTY